MVVLLILTLLFLTLPARSQTVSEEELLSLLYEKSPELLISRESVREAKSQREATKREFFPRLTLSASFSEFYPDLFGNWNQNYTFSASLTAEPVNFSRFVKLKIDTLTISLEREKELSLFIEKAYQLLSLAYTVKAYEKRIALKEETLEITKELLSVAQEKYKKGLVMITDVLKARAEVERVKGELASLKAEKEKNFNSLNEILDFSLSSPEEISLELKETYPEEIKDKKSLLKEALSKRPEIKRAALEVKSAELEIDYTRSTLRPSLTLSASWSRSGTSFWPQDRSYSAGITLSFPVFDSGLTKYRVLARESSLKRAELNLRAVKNSIKREVLDAISEINSSFENLKSSRSFLEFSEKSYERAFNEYKLGVSDIVALIQAHSSLNNARDSYVNALLNYNLSLLKLKKAVGAFVRKEVLKR